MEQLLNSYYEDNAKKLHNIVNQIFNRHYGGTLGKDMDEFYGVATDVLVDAWYKYKDGRSTYDSSKGDFDGYVYRAVGMAIIDEFKKRNRDKRTDKIEAFNENGEKIKIPVSDIRLDAPVGDNENLTCGDMIQSGFSVEDEVFKGIEYLDESTQEFLDNLSDMQKEISLLIMKGYESDEIKDILKITDRQYKDCWAVITSYEKKRILYKENNIVEEKEMNTMITEGNVTEKYKNTSYSIDSISKQLKKKRIRDDHILQRHSGQWKSFAKSELISDILRGKSLTQIIISEEIKNGIRMQWLIDGKQRCTTLDDYLHDGFAISKNVKNYNVAYQAPKEDENGGEVLNEDGFTDMVWKTFDIRGKKFSQLPEELQDIFTDRQIPVLYNMNCSKKDIADDIARFNRSRPMNKAQNGWLGLEESFAEFVENIAKMQFFQPEFAGSTYTKNNITTGAIRRIIVESIMVSDFIDEFGDFDKMCEFLSEEASDSNFTEFYSLVERLTVLCNTKEIASLFNAKDSFLWFGLFSRFVKLGLDDVKFAKFMSDFENLKTVKIDGQSFKDILENCTSTKDKSIVIKKINHLEKLMNTYLNNSSNNEDNAINFITENLDIDKDSLIEDMDFYVESLNKLKKDVISEESKLWDERCQVPLLAILIYSYIEGIDIEKWLKQYSNKDIYITDPKQIFLHMKTDFDSYFVDKNIEKMSA